MSSKRPSSNGFPVPQQKKSRLEVSIRSASATTSRIGQQIGRTGDRPTSTTGTINFNHPATTVVPAPSTSDTNGWWDNEEDDALLVLATQNVECVRQAHDSINFDIVSSGAFQPDKHASTSTQKPIIISDDEDENCSSKKNVPVTAKAASNECFFDMMDTDFDVDPLLLWSSPVPKSPIPKSPVNCLSNGYGSTNREQRNGNIQKNIETAKNTQIKFMSNELEYAKQQKKRLEEENKLLTERCQTKDGEIAMVRYDLQQNQKRQTELRQEKLDECEKIKSELVAKIAELEFKSLDARKGRQSLNKSIVGASKQLAMSEQDMCLLMKLNLNLSINVLQPKTIDNEMFTIYEHSSAAPHTSTAACRPNSQRDMHQKQVLLVQSNLAQLLVELSAGCAPNSTRLHDIANIVWDVAAKCFQDIYHHVSKLLPQDPICNNPYSSDAKQSTRLKMLKSSVHQDREMFDNERLHTLRQLLAHLSYVGLYSQQFCDLVVNRMLSDDKSCCSLLIESLRIIGHAKSWLQYAGIVETSCRLLSAMAIHYIDAQLSESMLNRLLHATVFCRPTGRALLYIARFLHSMSTHYATSEFLQDICTRSNDKIILNKKLQIICFNWQTCTLQIYGMCLQKEFLDLHTVHPEQLELLVELAEHTMLLLQNCAKKPVHWMLRQPSLRPCSCYAHLVCASVMLLHQCFKTWSDRPKCLGVKVLARLAKLAIVSLHDNFMTHCESIVLLAGGTTVKQRLHWIFFWIVKHQQLFNLNCMHERALSNISFLRRIPYMVEPVRTEGAPDAEVVPVQTVPVPNWKDVLDKHL